MKKRGLATAVRADNPHALAFVQDTVNTVKHRFSGTGIGKMNILQFKENGHILGCGAGF
jgi:hypothetical protein